MRNNRKQKELNRLWKKLDPSPHLKPETKKSVVGVLMLGLAVLLILARMGNAGPLGNLFFSVLNRFFGLGFYLIPAVAIAVAILFFISHERKFMGLTFAGAGGVILFGLGLIDLIFPDHGGLIGKGVGLLKMPLGVTAAIILAATFFIISLLIATNASIRFTRRIKNEKPKELGEVESIVEEEPEPEPEPTEEKESEKEEVEPEIKEAVSQKILTTVPITAKNYVPPPLSLLKSMIEKPTPGDLRANANIIKRTLESFGIPVEMGEINIGPKVTRYTLKPAEGVKLAKITTLNQDLSLALAAHPIRIEAPIPGKSLVGIEVPNKAAAIVRLGSLLAFEDFTKSGPLAFPLGRDVSGEPIFVNLEKMPHLLVAGSTGSGKSITIHSLLISLLYKNAPGSLRLILIDPKRVELSLYDGLPHLVSPVITDAKKSAGVFRWAIAEMERRYETLLSAGARDTKSYNRNHENEPIPYLVLVVDEMADLMARYGREIEGSIVRLAQMARATGIHLILSTQRPSVEVVTGLIKANITTRIALQVASQIDSRTILDSAGAEKLLGGGDMLFISSEFSKPKRIQGAYLSEEEMNGVISFINAHNEAPVAQSTMIDDAARGIAPNGDLFDGYEDEEDNDELYHEAVTVIREAGRASASFLQRRLKVGYARAARLLDQMEERGVIGPGDGAKPREILIESQNNNGTETS